MSVKTTYMSSFANDSICPIIQPLYLLTPSYNQSWTQKSPSLGNIPCLKILRYVSHSLMPSLIKYLLKISIQMFHRSLNSTCPNWKLRTIPLFSLPLLSTLPRSANKTICHPVVQARNLGVILDNFFPFIPYVLLVTKAR